MTPLQQAESDVRVETTCISFCELTIKELVYNAYRAGRATEGGGSITHGMQPPSVAAVGKAIAELKEHAVALADAQRRVRENTPGTDNVRDLLREAINLAAVGDITETTEAHGWGDWMRRSKAFVGDPLAEPDEAVKDDTWDFYGLPRTRVVASAPVYYWQGREGRSTRIHDWVARPPGSDHVVVDETRMHPNEQSQAFVCRIVDSVEPLSLGHTVVISREELEPVGDDWKPLGKGGTTTGTT